MFVDSHIRMGATLISQWIMLENHLYLSICIYILKIKNDPADILQIFPQRICNYRIYNKMATKAKAKAPVQTCTCHRKDDSMCGNPAKWTVTDQEGHVRPVCGVHKECKKFTTYDPTQRLEKLKESVVDIPRAVRSKMVAEQGSTHYGQLTEDEKMRLAKQIRQRMEKQAQQKKQKIEKNKSQPATRLPPDPMFQIAYKYYQLATGNKADVLGKRKQDYARKFIEMVDEHLKQSALELSEIYTRRRKRGRRGGRRRGSSTIDTVMPLERI